MSKLMIENWGGSKSPVGSGNGFGEHIYMYEGDDC